MVGRLGDSTAAGTLPGWSLLFAREPVSDGESGQADMDKTVVLGPPGKKPDSKPPLRQRILFLLLLMTFAVVGGYFAMHPEMLMTLLGGEPPHISPVTPVQKTPQPITPAIPPPASHSSNSLSEQPTPAIPAASAASPTSATGGPSVPVPVKPDIPLPPPTIPVPVSTTPAPSTSPALPAQTPKPPIPVPVPVPMPTPVTAAPVIPSPHFHEGQKVTVTAQTSLTTDSAGTKPGPPVRLGSMLTVLDADLQHNAWVYSVKTETGSMGWISEKNLKLK